MSKKCRRPPRTEITDISECSSSSCARACMLSHGHASILFHAQVLCILSILPGIRFFVFFLLIVLALFVSYSHWDFFVEMFLYLSCPADHVLDWQPRVLLGVVEARFVNVNSTHTYTHQREWHRMTRMTRPDCAVMCNLINTHTHTHATLCVPTFV